VSQSPQAYLPRIVRYWEEDTPGATHRAIEGSMVFVDISGFTKMSERLARQGRVGAEELTVIIDSTFGALLSSAYAYGANLLKFGGDALLLFFTGDGHQPRSCAAAQAMQRTMREVGVCKTSAGTVVLRMSVGINSGEFDFFLVGESHRELIVAGPAATRTVEMESTAQAGQILISPAAASALPSTNRGRPLGPGFLLRGKVEAEESQFHSATSPGLELRQFVPIGLCDLLVGGEIQPEHRPATVAFLLFHGFDSLIQKEGCDTASARLDALVRAVQGAVDRRGITFLGSDVAADGGKIILTAGVPSSTGNDEEQMLLAVRQVLSEGPALPLSVGINWGRVFAGEIGTSYRRTYTVMGDTVNLAARLMARAPAGEAYATPAVLDGSRTTFETARLEPFMVKGKKLPVEAVSVGDPIGSTQEGAGLPLIGRDRELATLNASWENALTRAGQVVEISAEAGMGKSRLLEEFLTACSATTVVMAECQLYQAATAYFPFRALLRSSSGLNDLGPDEAEKALRELVAAKAPEIAPWLALVAVVMGIEMPESVEVSQLEDEFRPARTLEAVAALLEATVTDPTVFVVEDTHWMDEPSRELLGGLLARLGRAPWLFILTRRPGDDGFVAPAEVSSIELGPLGVDEAKRLIHQATADSPLPSDQVEGLARQANGRPLFLVELLKTLRSKGSLDEVPQSVEALIDARIDTLPLAERNVLRRLSVLGAGFDIEHASAVLPDGSLEPHQRTRAIRGLSEFLSLDRSGRVQFHHALIRDVAYDGLPFRTRQDLHARVGESIFAACDGRPEEFAELLSFHYFNAKKWSRSWRFSRMAGDKARDTYANHEAALFYERALQSGASLDWVEAPDRADVLTDLARVRYEAGSYGEAITALRSAIRLIPDDPVARADLRLELARCQQRAGAGSQALRETALGLKLVDGGEALESRRAAARLLSYRAGLMLDQLSPRRALEVGLRAVAEAEATDELGALARAYTNIDEAYQILGRRDDAVHEEKALEIYEELGDQRNIAVVAIGLGVQAYADGRWDDAISMYTKAREVSGRSGNVTVESAAAANLGEVLISRGRLDEAETILEEARRVLRGQKYLGFALFAETQLARLRMERGDHEEAVKALTGIIDEAERSGQPYYAVDAALQLADALTRAGDPERALEVVDVAGDFAGDEAALYEVPQKRLRASALAGLARPVEALADVEAALASAREQRLAYEVALLLLLRAELEDDEGLFEEAGRLLEEIGAASPQLRTRLPSPML
jgi:class 3 adenylate cyclase/tetratricopeptide (TPR) repeat protein